MTGQGPAAHSNSDRLENDSSTTDAKDSHGTSQGVGGTGQAASDQSAPASASPLSPSSRSPGAPSETRAVEHKMEQNEPKGDEARDPSHERGKSVESIAPQSGPSTDKEKTSPVDRSSRTILPADSAVVSEWSHQHMAPNNPVVDEEGDDDGGWQEMPAYAQYDMYDDDGRQIARAHDPNLEEAIQSPLAGPGKGYSRVQIDEDAKSTTSLDDNTAYLFKEPTTNLDEEDDDEVRDPLAQMQATKDLLSENQKIAYVGLVRLAIADMTKDVNRIERTRGTKKPVDLAIETNKMWTQKIMIRLYGHMELDSAEQIMIEQLAEHGLQPGDMTPTLMQNSRVNNPVMEKDVNGVTPLQDEEQPQASPMRSPSTPAESFETPLSSPGPPPAYEEHQNDSLPAVRTPYQLPRTEHIDIDLRWTVLCDLFLILVADSHYDAPSRVLLERVGAFLDVSWLDICRFEKRVTDALEMQEASEKDTWTEDEHMAKRKKMARRRRLVMMGLATVGGSLVIGLSAGLLAPVIGAGLAAGFTTIGVSGTSGFLAGAGGAAIVGTTGVITGGTVGVKAANKRTGAVSTFEYRPLYNNKRVNLIVTISGWLIGKVDDVRLPFSTIDPIMGDIYSIFWEPEMLTSMGQTISILATEALTQGLQQLLGSTILMSLMAALQLPIVLTKLSYLIDNPWSNSLARADRAGLILADSLIDRNLGARPITLVGFSIGSRVIYAALQELAKRGAINLVQNVYIFGSPMVANKDEWLKARTVVSGRFVNGYAVNDWILGYLFRATAGAISRVAGLAPLELPGIENVDVTHLVKGHMAYRQAMPRILREVGWAVTSDEFSEIEDPDPDNHEKRQRELINEIEEARKELQQKEGKKGWGFFRKKKLAEKKQWEIYDDQAKAEESDAKSEEPGQGNANALFDIEAIRKEAVELAAKGLEIKQLETTLPPLKVESTVLNQDLPIRSRPASTLRETKSDANLPLPSPGSPARTESRNSDAGRKEVHRWPEEQNISMTFESEYSRPAWPRRFHSHLSPHSPSTPTDGASDRASTHEHTDEHGGDGDLASTQHMFPDDDEDDEFKEKEVEMTFA